MVMAHVPTPEARLMPRPRLCPRGSSRRRQRSDLLGLRYVAAAVRDLGGFAAIAQDCGLNLGIIVETLAIVKGESVAMLSITFGA